MEVPSTEVADSPPREILESVVDGNKAANGNQFPSHSRATLVVSQHLEFPGKVTRRASMGEYMLRKSEKALFVRRRSQSSTAKRMLSSERIWTKKTIGVQKVPVSPPSSLEGG